MMEFTVTEVIGASAAAIYDSFLDSDAHTAMTGAPAVVNAELDKTFTAWEGYITGKNIELRPKAYIKQSWRTAHFLEGQEDSIVEITLDEIDVNKTRVTIHHSNLTEAGRKYETGWFAHYFEPMKNFFEK